VHVFFNLTSVAVLYPLKPLRNFPVKLAMTLSSVISKRRYMAVVYVLVTFVLLPLLGIVLFN
jgi:sodium-dependent phosphate cotransporter